MPETNESTAAVAVQVDCHVRPLVERLRSPASISNLATADRWMIEAADEIERLRAALASLCEAADATNYPQHGTSWDRLWNTAVAARAVLGASPRSDS